MWNPLHRKDNMEQIQTFNVDTANSDNERLYVDINGLGTIVIVRTPEGIVIDAFPFTVVDEPTGTVTLWADDFIPEE